MSDTSQIFRLPKQTGTHADVFAAVGLADLLQSLFEKPVQLRDEGALFLIVPPGEFSGVLEKLPHSPRYPWLFAGTGDPQALMGLTAINMSEEFQRVKRWFENQRKIRQQKNPDPDLLQLLQKDAPISRWWICAPLTATKLKAISTWNRVAECISRTPAQTFRTQVGDALQAVATGSPSKIRWPATSNGLFVLPK